MTTTIEHKNDLKKVVRLGTIDVGGERQADVFCEIEITEGKLSITGVEGPLRNGNALGGCGQIDMHLREHVDSIKPAPGWDQELLVKFFDVWQRWHLNDMRAGSPAQEQWLKANPIDAKEYAYPKSHYEVVSAKLASVGLNPDANGYSYGHSWNREELPQDAVEFLASLPVTDKQPAWV